MGVQRLDVAYDYSDRIPSDPRRRDGNTLDIGLFDPRGIAPSSPGFRGWSGSHKLAFTLTPTWATPPYLAGPLPAGTWHVLLGPYKVGPRGCQYEVHITFGDEPGQPPPRPGHVDAAPPRPAHVDSEPPTRRPAAEPGWLRGDLHSHTRHTDGDAWPADMLAEAVRRGLDFLGVTDHNQTGHQADYARVTGAHLPLLLPGIEVTTYGGHWNAWGTSTWWEFRQPEEASVSRAMQAAAAAGAVVSVNHPKPFGPAWEYPNATGYHAIEVWNGPFGEGNAESVAFWERQLRGGRRVTALGGSDTHILLGEPRTDRLGVPTTWAYVGRDRTPAGVLNALRSGQVFVSRDVDGPQLYLSRAPDGVRVHVAGAHGAVLALFSDAGRERALPVAGDDWTDVLRRGDECAYVRAELTSAGGEMLALSNAV
jgi:hypothetical protein